MQERVKSWARAFAKQAKADLASYEMLKRSRTQADSQALHFLQMACEKFAKAASCGKEADIERIQKSHLFIAKELPPRFMEQYRRSHRGKFPGQAGLYQRISDLALEIELLHPRGKNHGGRPDNCEYPWEDGRGNLHVPAEHAFPLLDPLGKSSGTLLLKFLPRAIDELIETP